jgi:hypothetical protein
VAGHEWAPQDRQFRVDDMEVGAAHTAGTDAQKDLAGSSLRLGNVHDAKVVFLRV